MFSKSEELLVNAHLVVILWTIRTLLTDRISIVEVVNALMEQE